MPTLYHPVSAVRSITVWFLPYRVGPWVAGRKMENSLRCCDTTRRRHRVILSLWFFKHFLQVQTSSVKRDISTELMVFKLQLKLIFMRGGDDITVGARFKDENVPLNTANTIMPTLDTCRNLSSAYRETNTANIRIS